VLFLSRISWKKGLDTLIPTFAEVIKKEPKTVLVIAGGDDEGYGENLKSQISNLKINNSVIFTGMLLGNDKIAAYRESDVFVLPSYSENFGQTVVESMACGTAVVITKNVGVAPSVERVGTGIVIEKNEKQLTEAILKILGNPKIAVEMGKRGRELVEKEFFWPEIVEKLMKEYNVIINNH
ncbi:MAG: glycosyltransferase, partial [Patescibacteria group bacterium]